MRFASVQSILSALVFRINPLLLGIFLSTLFSMVEPCRVLVRMYYFVCVVITALFVIYASPRITLLSHLSFVWRKYTQYYLFFIWVNNDKKQLFVYRPKWWFIFVWWASDHDRFCMHILVVVARLLYVLVYLLSFCNSCTISIINKMAVDYMNNNII